MNPKMSVVSPSRAQELLALSNWQNFGCLIISSNKPDVKPENEEERTYVNSIWETMSGNTCYNDALVKIAQGKTQSSPEDENPANNEASLFPYIGEAGEAQCIFCGNTNLDHKIIPGERDDIECLGGCGNGFSIYISPPDNERRTYTVEVEKSDSGVVFVVRGVAPDYEPDEKDWYLWSLDWIKKDGMTEAESLMDGLHGELYDLYQMSSQVKKGDIFEVPPFLYEKWDQKKIESEKTVRFYCVGVHVLNEEEAAYNLQMGQNQKSKTSKISRRKI